MKCKKVEIADAGIWLLCPACFSAFDQGMKHRDKNGEKIALTEEESLWINKEFWNPEDVQQLVRSVFEKARISINAELNGSKLPLTELYGYMLNKLKKIGEEHGLAYPPESEVDDVERRERIHIAGLGNLINQKG